MKKTANLRPPKLKITYIEKEERLHVHAPQGWEVTLNGADVRQLVGKDLSVVKPLTKKSVRLSFKAVHTPSGSCMVTKDYTVAIPGCFSGKPAQPKPAVIPEIAEWYSSDTSIFVVSDTTCLIIPPYLKGTLEAVARELCHDYAAVTGKNLSVIYSDQPETGAVCLTLDSTDTLLGDEGYRMRISRSVQISAQSPTGIYMASRTLLQLLKKSGDNSIPCGEMRDYPKYAVRGFMIDVGRRPMSLSMLKILVRNMAWYKMNDLQIHLNDNYIWLEEYNTTGDEKNTFHAYEAMRLESGLKNANGESATARDYFYTKSQFKELIDYAAGLGVRIVPEIDVPAHALAFAKVFPEYMVKNQFSPLKDNRPLTDHLDVSRQEVIDFIKTIFDDYTKGETAIFTPDITVHIGADEFLSDYSAYRRFFNQMIPYIKQTNPVRVWGGLTWIQDQPLTPIEKDAIENVQMNLWAKGWADGVDMYEMGFHIINTIDSLLYMVPNGKFDRGSYRDLLNKKAVLKKFHPNKVQRKIGKYVMLPAGDKRVLGAAYALWNDNIDKRAHGLTEVDLFERFFDALPLMADKTWADSNEKRCIKQVDALSAILSKAPYADPGEAPECPQNIYKKHTAAVTLTGNSCFTELGLQTLPYGNALEFTVKFEEVLPGGILFEADAPYAEHDIRITRNGKLGFTREGYEYEFDFAPPKGREITLEIRNPRQRTELIVNGQEKKRARGAYILDGIERCSEIKNASFCLPAQRIGSAVNAAQCTIRNITFKKL